MLNPTIWLKLKLQLEAIIYVFKRQLQGSYPILTILAMLHNCLVFLGLCFITVWHSGDILCKTCIMFEFKQGGFIKEISKCKQASWTEWLLDPWRPFFICENISSVFFDYTLVCYGHCYRVCYRSCMRWCSQGWRMWSIFPYIVDIVQFGPCPPNSTANCLLSMCFPRPSVFSPLRWFMI